MWYNYYMRDGDLRRTAASAAGWSETACDPRDRRRRWTVTDCRKTRPGSSRTPWSRNDSWFGWTRSRRHNLSSSRQPPRSRRRPCAVPRRGFECAPPGWGWTCWHGPTRSFEHQSRRCHGCTGPSGRPLMTGRISTMLCCLFAACYNKRTNINNRTVELTCQLNALTR